MNSGYFFIVSYNKETGNETIVALWIIIICTGIRKFIRVPDPYSQAWT